MALAGRLVRTRQASQRVKAHKSSVRSGNDTSGSRCRLASRVELESRVKKKQSLSEFFKVEVSPKGGGDGAERSFGRPGVDCDEGRSECVIALQGSFEKQHLRASVVP